MTATQPDSQKDRRLGRRTFVKGLGVAGAGAVGLSGRGRFGAVGGVEAVAPLVAGAIGTAVAVEWALREFDVVGSDAPPEGLTADALKQQVYQTARTRKSTNASTIVDNQNILDGIENTAYTEAKVKAIEEMNAGSSESAVLDAATSAANSYFATIERNLLKTWKETLAEFDNLLSAMDSHPDLTRSDLTAYNSFAESGESQNGTYVNSDYPGDDSDVPVWPDYTDETVTLADGSTMTIRKFGHEFTGDPSPGYKRYSPTGYTGTNDGRNTVYAEAIAINDPSGGHIAYLDRRTWTSIWSEIQTVVDNVNDGISTWVTNVYGDVQSGDIEIDDLVTPRERAAIMADEESGSQAVADLIALNVPVDLENEATITIPSTGLNLRGSFGLTDESDGPLEAGTQYDPSTFSGDVYFTTDLSLLEGDWTAFETGVDGGTITITQEPYEGTILSVTTAADETVDVPAAEWTDNGDGTWSYDASGDVENSITEVESVSYYSEAESTQYETLNLKNPFNIESFENTETGEQTQQASFTSAEPQNDSNYVSQEEWNQLEEQNQELIEKYEESQNSGGGAGGGFFNGESPDIGLIAAVVGGAGVVYALIGQGEN